MDKTRIRYQMPNETKIEQIKKRYAARLLSYPNVVGVGIGLKEIGGIRRVRKCLKIYVQKKIPQSQLTKGTLIPSMLDGIETDVEEIGRPEAK